MLNSASSSTCNRTHLNNKLMLQIAFPQCELNERFPVISRFGPACPQTCVAAVLVRPMWSRRRNPESCLSGISSPELLSTSELYSSCQKMHGFDMMSETVFRNVEFNIQDSCGHPIASKLPGTCQISGALELLDDSRQQVRYRSP